MAKVSCPMCGEECFASHLVKTELGRICRECRDDMEIARQRLKEITADPSNLVTGDELQATLEELTGENGQA